jgi:transcriptional regulator with PAS, ATPase and Fis domain
MIAEALGQTKNNQQQAAKLLGLSRQGLLNKMKRYAIAGTKD